MSSLTLEQQAYDMSLIARIDALRTQGRPLSAVAARVRHAPCRRRDLLPLRHEQVRGASTPRSPCSATNIACRCCRRRSRPTWARPSSSRAPVLLVLGVFARLGAAALLVMTLTIQFLVYPENWPEHLMWASILAYVLSRGPGALSIDRFVALQSVRPRVTQETRHGPAAHRHRRRGLWRAERRPRRSPAPHADVTVIDRRNYHLFQPLLYQVATAGLSPAQIASPIRAILRKAANVRVHAGQGHRRSTSSAAPSRSRTARIAYDYLVLATGARHCLFRPRRMGGRGARPQEDRRRHRHPPPHPDRLRECRGGTTAHEARRRLLTFVVIGGGADRRGDGRRHRRAGARGACAMTSATSIPREARIVLVEAGPRLLPAFPPMLSNAARESLEQAGRRGPPRHAGHAMRRRRRDDRRAIGWSRRRSSGAPASWPPSAAHVARRRQGSRRPGHGRARSHRCPAIPRSSASATPPTRSTPTASRCLASRRWPSSRVPTSRAVLRAHARRQAGARAVPLSRLGAPWRRSAGAPPSPTSAG